MLLMRNKPRPLPEPPTVTAATMVEPVVITEQQVLLSTAAAAALAPGREPQRTVLFVRLRQLRIHLPEPRPVYPRRESRYLETARMSREMGHL
ncbi:hypothetical protein Mycch_0170 [Mycolicibacterium chubuense NBB4]|uniref:Uncharacterized protein n=1 Tax=Mycolicibacterium chubuense (strain NBB4) TaxID=710421 RepID=I4BCI9_MYCCN|nr:hypothetical protein [Mycolicibacterium chubuense]AFM14996.1 hypothetical protein Mycch_0170 [Mycolicibacterium chubuense NBB4]